MSTHPHRRSRLTRGGRLAIATGIALVAGALVVPVVSATTATTPSSKHLHDDFNGDGYPDLAVGAPATKSTGTSTGAVSVLYGSSSGLSLTRKQVLDASKETSASPVSGYGSGLQSADLDGDGYADLLSYVRWTPAGGSPTPTVTVNWGGPKGLSSTRTQLLKLPEAAWTSGFTVGDVDGDKHPDVVTLGEAYGAQDGNGGTVLHGPFTRAGSAAGSDRFVYAPEGLEAANMIAAGDVNGDGIDDIAIGAHSTEESDSRATALLLGGANGLTRAGWLRDTTNRSIGGEDIAIGDLNKDGYGDIVVGHAFDGMDSDVELPTKGGALGVVYGGPAGLSTTRKPVWINQDTPGVPGVGEYHDGMGSALSIGDTNGDGYLDVVTGLPGEDFDGITDAGSVLVLRGSANGLTGTGAKSFSQDTAGVPGAAEKADQFGTQTALLDANGDKKDGLVVGDPAENADNGSVWVFSATSGGITASGSTSFGAAKVGLPAAKARFGASLGD
ncbi:FG-GAP-like repeat-containing protein [Streptomyces sp. NPDC086549]|uniref:FG-GAP-like repeat-containing protein n=1 Tax=Streptomyces sp. NPDC086549 TaxID=3365752 RepID=UPI00380EE308